MKKVLFCLIAVFSVCVSLIACGKKSYEGMKSLLEERDYDAITKSFGDGYTELESDSYEDIKYESVTIDSEEYILYIKFFGSGNTASKRICGYCADESELNNKVAEIYNWLKDLYGEPLKSREGEKNKNYIWKINDSEKLQLDAGVSSDGEICSFAITKTEKKSL